MKPRVHSVKKFTRKIRDCMPTFIINYIMIFETPRRKYPKFCAWNAPWHEAKISDFDFQPRFSLRINLVYTYYIFKIHPQISRKPRN